MPARARSARVLSTRVHNGLPTKDKLKVVGWKAANFRRLQKMTIAQVAARAHLAPSYVSGLERGKHNPTLDVIFRLAHALRCWPGALL